MCKTAPFYLVALATVTEILPWRQYQAGDDSIAKRSRAQLADFTPYNAL